MDNLITKFRPVFGLILNYVSGWTIEGAKKVFASSPVSKTWNQAIENWANQLYGTLQKENGPTNYPPFSRRKQLFSVLLEIENKNLKVIWKSKLSQHYTQTLEYFPIFKPPTPEASASEILNFYEKYKKYFITPVTSLDVNQIWSISDQPYRNYYFSHLGLTSIPEMINLLALQGVFFRNNQIRELPTYINYPELRSCNLHKNLLKQVPNNLNTTMPSLKELDLQNNLFDTFPDFSHKILNYLNLSNNSITCIPDAHWLLANFPELNTLKLDNNKIGKDSKNVENLIILAKKRPKLTVTYKGNPISEEN